MKTKNTCACGKAFSTAQGLGLHFSWRRRGVLCETGPKKKQKPFTMKKKAAELADLLQQASAARERDTLKAALERIVEQADQLTEEDTDGAQFLKSIAETALSSIKAKVMGE